ncbi:hypothetical protein FSC37_18085 [Piscinibacter aquaticus]|uniref:PNPLA domain-containing protein n=1 Tax=Piscinibacter aquaticus TaxID=392597 RepID=A0A5C6U4K0_9BURK|nr:hypothetical protein FSC37_18085 [Piscinibacter aquaticus]
MRTAVTPASWWPKRAACDRPRRCRRPGCRSPPAPPLRWGGPEHGEPHRDTAAPSALALVLGSGGVRSIAALGVTDVLARHGIQPDLVVGCSSGALFGALIAARTPPAEGLAQARRLWSAELTGQRNWRAYAQLLVPRWAGFDADFALRRGTLIAERINAAFGDRRIETLPLPLRIAATDAATGEPVLLTRGPLAAALCASMAVPFLFPPVRIDGQRLVDGVVSDPLPVSAALDADVLVTLGFEDACRVASTGPRGWWPTSARPCSTT